MTIEQQTALRGIEQQFAAALADPEFFRATVEAVVDRVRFPRAGQGWEALEPDDADAAAEDCAGDQDMMDDDAHESAARDAPDGSALERGQTAGRTRRGKRAGRRRDRRQQE